MDDVEAVVLVGGRGTRLQPLTLSCPKPMLPTAGVPFLEHLLAKISNAGIRRVVLGTSYRAETFSDYFGDGSDLGLQIDYVFEPAPLGTGGGIRHVLNKITADTVMVFNGDVLSGVDLAAIVQTHRANDADVTLHLVKVPDPRAFGSVPTLADGRVQAFLEKCDSPPTDQINAGCYVFRRSVIEAIPAGRVVSVERETFPGLLNSGARVFGHTDSSYWLDLGTPRAFVQGSADLVTGVAPTVALGDSSHRSRDFRAGADAEVAGDAVLDFGSSIGSAVSVGAAAIVRGSVLFDGAAVGKGSLVENSVIGTGSVIGDNVVVRNVIVGDNVVIGDNCELQNGMRIWPGARIAAGTIRFSAAG